VSHGRLASQQRLNDEDVALDMDEVVVDVIDDEEGESSGGDDSEDSSEYGAD